MMNLPASASATRQVAAAWRGRQRRLAPVQSHSTRRWGARVRRAISSSSNVVFDEKNLTGKNTLFTYYFTTNVPELSTWAMFGIGFAGIGLVGLSRRGKGSRYAF
jgi:hypothetical protein